MSEAIITSYKGGLVTEEAILVERQGWEVNDFFGKGRSFALSHSLFPSGPVSLFESGRKFGAIPQGESYSFEGFDTEGNPMTITVTHHSHIIRKPHLRVIK